MDARRTVLIVEHDAELRELLMLAVNHLGYRPLAAADGREALQLLQATPADLVLADVSLPNMDGLALALALRGTPRTARMPIVLLSATWVDPAGLHVLYDGHLRSPFTLPQLRAAIAAHIVPP